MGFLVRAVSASGAARLWYLSLEGFVEREAGVVEYAAVPRTRAIFPPGKEKDGGGRKARSNVLKWCCTHREGMRLLNLKNDSGRETRLWA